MRLKLWVLAIFVSAVTPALAAGKKLAGKVLDVAAFSSVKAYCIDTTHIRAVPGVMVNPGNNQMPYSTGGRYDSPQAQAYDVGEVMKRESAPKGLLSKLPWKLEASCSAPDVDAVVRFNFYTTAGISNPQTSAGPTQQRQVQQDQIVPVGWRAQLQVFDKSPPLMIYRAEGVPLGSYLGPTGKNQEDLSHTLRQSAADNALAALVSDVKATSKNP